jgi:hypothetical protein
LQIQGNVTLYASTPVVFTILNTLIVPYLQTLKDSTSADVPFNMVFNGSTNATASIVGDWVFEGAAPLSNRLTAGATFTIEAGASVAVSSTNYGVNYDYQNYQPAQIIFKNNTGTVSNSDFRTLVFTYNTHLIFDNDLDATIPAANWFGDQLDRYGRFVQSPAASIQLKTNMRKLAFAQTYPDLTRLVIDLAGLDTDAGLALPDGSNLRNNLEVYNTNGHTLSLLAANSPASSVTATVWGNIVVNGNNSKVAIATAAAAAPATSFYLTVLGDFNQAGGNFSLQEYNGATGISGLSCKSNFYQTGGTFYTNSNSTVANFSLKMAEPAFNAGASGSFNSLRTISASSGTIDNATHNVTLRIEHSVYIISQYESNPNGVQLLSPLSVGKLELVRSPLTTSALNVLTVNNPSLDAITIGGQSTSYNNGYALAPSATSYVNGPVRRATNSTQAYFFPTGKGYFYDVSNGVQAYHDSFLYDSCYVIPASSAPSVYQAEYFNKGYQDLNVTAPLLSVSNKEYWDFTKVSGADAQVKFKLRAPVVTAASSSSLVAAHYENGHWVSVQGSTMLPCALADSFIVSKTMSAFSPFTFGYVTDASVPVVPANRSKGLSYKFYQGTFTSLPDFNALTPVTSGTSNNVDPGVRPAGTDYNYAIKWDGYITIKTPGTYTFETNSDDGSKVYFNSPYCAGAAGVVDNDGVHGTASVTGSINITAAGTYPITVTYFQNYSAQSLQLYWAGPGISRQAIPDSVFSNAGGSTTPYPAGTGLNYKYYEGDFNTLPDFSALTPVKTGYSPNVDISVRTPGVNDYFAFVWEGTINIPTAGTYTFETVSDDGSKLYFNGNNLVNNDGLHAPTSVTGTVTLAAGTYPISISFFEKDGGESMQVYWTGPGIARQQIPDAVFGSGTVTPPTEGSGLNYKYYEGDFNTLPDFNALTPVRSGTSANADITVRTPGVNDYFAFFWQGTINLPSAGTYTFETISDDGSKVYFNMPYSANGNSLVNNDGLHAPNSATGTVMVPTAGAYPITITFFEKDGGETMQLYWSGPGIPRQLIPDADFISDGQPPVTNNNGLNYKYYEGNFDVLPDYSTLTPLKTGTTNNVDISIRPAGVNDYFAFTWDGYINLPSAGSYTFETISDDGSKVYFNMPYTVIGNSIVNNDGLHAPNSATGIVTVPSARRYPISVTFFEKNGGQTMELYWTGPGISRQLVPDAAFTTNNALLNTSVMLATRTGSLLNTLPDVNTTSAMPKVYPNPFADHFTIDYYNPGSTKNNVSVALYDLNGKLIYNFQPASLLPGDNRWLVNLGGIKLARGIYMAKLSVNGIPATTIKLIRANK